MISSATVKRNHVESHAEPQRAAGAYPLPLATQGQPVQVAAVRGKDEQRRHLANLGFMEGAQLSVVCQNKGDLIVDIKGSRVAVGCQVASRILVR